MSTQIPERADRSAADGRSEDVLDTEARDAPTEGRTELVLPVTRSGRRWVLLVLALALALRLALVATVAGGYQPVNDEHHYDFIASSIAEGDGYGEARIPPAVGPSAFRAPMYPATLAVVYAVFGSHSYTAGLAANAFVGTVLVAMVGLVASQVFGRRVGFVALALAAVHPTMLLFGSALLMEPLLATLQLAALAAALQHRLAPKGLRWPLVCGVLIGLTILTRELGLWLLVPALILVWPTSRGERLASPAVVIAAAALVVLPWSIRNTTTLDAFVPFTTTTGFGLAGTYNETAAEHDRFPAVWTAPYFDEELGDVLLAMEEPSEVDVDRVLREEAISYIADDPAYVGKVAFWNTVRLFDLNGWEHSVFMAEHTGYETWLVKLAVVSSYVMALLAAAGIAAGALRRAPKALWLFPVLAFVNIILILGAIRYRASIEPFTVMMGAVGVLWLGERVLGDRLPPEGAA